MAALLVAALGGCQTKSGTKSPETTCEKYRGAGQRGRGSEHYDWNCRGGALDVTIKKPSAWFDTPRGRAAECGEMTAELVQAFVSAGYNPRVDKLRINFKCRAVDRQESVTGRVTHDVGPTHYALQYDPNQDEIRFCGRVLLRNRVTGKRESFAPEDVARALEDHTTSGGPLWQHVGPDGEPDCN